MRSTSSWLITLVLLTTSISAKTPSLPHQNENALSISRYVDVLPGPTNAQKNPMNLVLPHISFKPNIKSVGQAINYLLSDTGYKLTRHHPDKRVHKLFRLPLPKIHRNMGPLSLAQALTVLAGDPWNLSVDPINRLVSFQLPGHFKEERNLANTKIAKANTVKTVQVKPLKYSSHQIHDAQKQYKRELESKRRALLDRKNKARLVKAKLRKQKLTAVRKKPKQIVRQSKKPKYQINWSDLPKELR